MSALAKLLAPYQAAIGGARTDPETMMNDPLYATLFQYLETDPTNQLPKTPGSAPNAAGLLELIYNGNAFNPSSVGGHESHLHVAMNDGIVRLGRYLQGLGFDVGEHPKFGGVAPVHVPNSHHFSGNALDVNYAGGGRWKNEARALNWLERFLSRRYG